MSTAPVAESTVAADETEEIMADPEVRASLEALDDPEDREDLIDHLKALKRLREGKDTLIPWDEAL
ncbi:MAG: hypothetical protein AB1646_04140 [Thermodesulfobacteriota bacterium]